MLDGAVASAGSGGRVAFVTGDSSASHVMSTHTKNTPFGHAVGGAHRPARVMLCSVVSMCKGGAHPVQRQQPDSDVRMFSTDVPGCSSRTDPGRARLAEEALAGSVNLVFLTSSQRQRRQVTWYELAGMRDSSSPSNALRRRHLFRPRGDASVRPIEVRQCTWDRAIPRHGGTVAVGKRCHRSRCRIVDRLSGATLERRDNEPPRPGDHESRFTDA
jgi:hypothetical protein